MRELSPQFTAALTGGATTLCNCWRLIPRNGAPLGFTDHDRDLRFDNMTFSAATGLEASAVESKLGFAVGGGEVSGALASAALTENDLGSGHYDGATVESWRVDWSNPEARLLVDIGSIGEVRRSEFAFTAEVRSIAHELDEPCGRLYQAGCAADLGDAKCRADVNNASFRVSTSIISSDGHLVFAINSLGFAERWFVGGVVEFLSGANAGLRATVKSHRIVGSHASIALWSPLAGAISSGDTLTVTAGCDKSFKSCREKFANQANFRGFPQMPGNDVVMSYANATDPNMDGGSLFR